MTRRVAVIFGGRSVEHEVSVITGHQVMAAFPIDRFTPFPLYIAKDGTWYLGDGLRDLSAFADVDALIARSTAVVPAVDVGGGGRLLRPRASGGLLRRGDAVVDQFDIAFPVVHGSHGEDGTLQGLFELADIAYTGCGVAAAAIGMDKPLAKRLFRAAGLPVLDDVVVTRSQWQRGADAVIADVEARIGFPAYVKPATLGSSIGVSRVDNAAELRDAAVLACAYDSRFLVEAAQEGIVEANCSILGWQDDVVVSVLEQPTKQGLLGYADKYAGGAKAGAKGRPAAKVSGGAKSAGMQTGGRIIPAPLRDELTAGIQDAARRAFAGIGAAGVARADFLVRPDEGTFILNEINTMPGSLSYYLWEASGLPFADLIIKLIDIAERRRAEKRESTFSIDDWLLRGASAAGAKSGTGSGGMERRGG